MSADRNLVIVESPAKAKTIGRYLGDDFTVAASVGHIRDLPLPKDLPAELKKGPYKKFAVDVENGFEPYYVVSPDKKKTVTELRRLLKDADALYLATDEDREGEAIAWHLLETLKPKKSLPVYRMVFHEITKDAIQRALHETRELDNRLVNAQETRRILDRIVGYELSPVLWRKVQRGTSAGRVQSVATRLVVDRERERMAFVPSSYWDITGEFSTADGADRTADTPAFTALLRTVDGARIASGRDFTDAGELKNPSVTVLTEESAASLISAIDGEPATVSGLESKPYTRRPAAPFTTSSLQQEASRKLRMSARQTMSTAQRLYENGYITYMRTDSVVLSGEAIRASRAQAADLYGDEYVPDRPRVYSSKSKSAQEAHEAIRPAGSNFRTPAEVGSQLSGDEFRLYELIWKRTIASQMADAKGTTTSVTLGVSGKGRTAEFTASGTIITFRGFLAAYEESRDQGRYDDDAKDKRLPQMSEGQALSVVSLTPDGHETTPPPRYTEASLVRALEERGIGRPSTYAATIGVIQDRGYVFKKGTALVPSWLAFSVVRLLEEHFGKLVDYDFTADMEAGLDRIAAGTQDRTEWLKDFYFGPENAGPGAAPDAAHGLKTLVDDLGEIDARAINTTELGEGIDLRIGQYGPYVERTVDGSPVRANVPGDLAPDELTLEKAKELLERQKDDGRALGTDPDTGNEIIVKDGRFGPYFTEVLEVDESIPKTKRPKPRTGSLLKSMDMATVTLEDALKVMRLPRVVGTEEDGTEITAQNGRYGPYLKKGTDSRSLQSEDQIFSITLEEAQAIYAQPKTRGRAAAKPPLKELGTDPTSEKPIVVKDGRFGPYITDGTTNVTLRRDDVLENLTHEIAVERLAEKRAKGPAKRRTTKRTTTRKAPAKKTTTSKAAQKR
ncbi:type I DNA topoisomerase [Helcobacillus massiliensis]|uniref:type I DNA topoisomerase n=1 Tax=Helcobacillus massiliensis TaxID=521392 RepID=UPI0021A26540|nr:type I DNA topoisomerase [Helcobacillus massiliensis]MCT1556622.1 type I DNA topoisomerase [Helcobacillus massiliensis]MCT2035816.1 type I DNA topoisomerase [Helcobacillus massiliensis]MCT2331102.1 type I DNA topoisomerase [Helcobacillus massiliensis]MDK7742019.1 type I DNA topoisomerase [Helcobacillus massiliensis]WOO93072.1 type I DNA topoisomerase [Helcobacillus massiliensis]